MSEHTAEIDARCPNCGGLLTGASHQTVCLINAAAEIARLRGRSRDLDQRTHDGNHAPLPAGAYLAPGFCDGCDAAQSGVIPTSVWCRECGPGCLGHTPTPPASTEAES